MTSRLRTLINMMRAQVMLAGVLALSSCAVPEPKATELPPADGPVIATELFLAAAGPAKAGAVFDLPPRPWQRVEVTLTSREPQQMAARIRCDGPARLITGDADLYLRPGAVRSFSVPPRRARPVRLSLDAGVSECQLAWGAGHAVQLRALDISVPSLAQLDRAREACVLPPTVHGGALARVFYAQSEISQTCAYRPGHVDFTADALDALVERLEALTGGPIDRNALLSGDPDQPLDFSRAPKLDLVAMSNLHIRADYSGHLTARALTYHAARGTRVRILVSGRLMLAQDRLYWEDLAARYPNVQIQYFAWDPEGPLLPGAFVDAVQRANHVKLFLTLSSEPGRSRVITGGRNLHDGFFFHEAFDLSSHPELRTYTDDDMGAIGLIWHSVYEDFEVIVRDDALVGAVASQFGKLWWRHADGTLATPQTAPGRTASAPLDGVARHFSSLPWADGHALEKYIVDAIDAAQSEILISTPFFYPPQSITDAMLAARARGVRVRVVTRIHSSDPPGFLTTAMNHAYVNKHLGDFETWNYEPEGRLVHTKLLLIDGQFGVVGSANFNGRTFLHDTENGLVFLDRALVARLTRVAETYIRNGEKIDTPLEASGLAQALGDLRRLWQYF